MHYSDKCKCCLETGRLRSMWDEYVRDGTREIYGQMMSECFALSWQNTAREEQICELCVGRLRNAVAFKNLVLETELLLLAHLDDNEAAENVSDSSKLDGSYDYEDVEYLETEYLEEPAQNNVFNKQSKLPSNCESPLKNLRKPPKRKAKIEDDKTSILEEVKMSGSVSARNRLAKKFRTETGNLQIGDTTIRKMPSMVLPGDLEEGIKPVKTELLTNTSDDTDAENNMDNEQEIETSELETYNTNEDKPVLHPLHEKYVERAKHQDNLRTILLCTNATPIRKHSDAGYVCGFCSRAFREAANLKQHTIEDHDNATKAKYMKEVPMFSFCVKLDITSLHCNLCGSEIDTLEQLYEHLKSDHNKTVHTDIKNHFIPYKINNNALNCFMCGQEFIYFKTITHHMSSHYKNFGCESCKIYFINKCGLNGHYRTHASGVFPCKYCSKVYNAKIKRTNHMRIVHQLGRYTISCGLCGEKFKEISAKEKHLEDHHGIERKPAYECYACDKTFFMRKSLKRHIDSFHLFIKNYKCAECSKEYFDKRTFVAHMVSHTGVKQYKCEMCSRLFSQKRTLDLHQRIHLNDRRYKCEYCGNSFIQKGSLLRHLKKIHDALI